MTPGLTNMPVPPDCRMQLVGVELRRGAAFQIGHRRARLGHDQGAFELAGVLGVDVIYIIVYFQFYFFSTFIYSMGPWHTYLLFIQLIFLLWINEEYRIKLIENKLQKWLNPRIGNVIIALLLLFSDVYNLRYYENELRFSFSGSKESGINLSSYYNSKLNLIGFPSACVSSILPYTKVKSLWYPEIEKNGSFINWDTTYMKNSGITINTVLERVSKKFPDSTNVMFIFSKSVVNKERLPENLQIIDSNRIQVFEKTDESFYFIRYKNKSGNSSKTDI